MIEHPYTNFLNQLKLASLQRQIGFLCVIPTRVKPLLRLLVSLNVLRRFYRLRGQQYRVHPAYTRSRRYARKIKTYLRSSGKLRMTLKAIQTLNIHTPHTYYVLETSQGIMTHKEALRHSVGGNLLLIVY